MQRGKHAELLAEDGLYRRIYDLELKDQEEALAARIQQKAESDVAGTSAGGGS